jgi:hypothetical protein
MCALIDADSRQLANRSFQLIKLKTLEWKVQKPEAQLGKLIKQTLFFAATFQ